MFVHNVFNITTYCYTFCYTGVKYRYIIINLQSLILTMEVEFRKIPHYPNPLTEYERE